MFKTLKKLFSVSGLPPQPAATDTDQGYTIDRGTPGGWKLQEVYGPGDEGLIRCRIRMNFEDGLGFMFGISDTFELEFIIGCLDWSFPEGGFFGLDLRVDDQPPHSVFAMTVGPSSMFVFAPQSMEFFESLKQGTYLTFIAFETEEGETVFRTSIGAEVFSIRLRNTAVALGALYDCACAAVPPEVAEKSFHTSDMLNDQDSIEDSMPRKLAEVTELTRGEADAPQDGKIQETGKEEAETETAEVEQGNWLLKPLLQMSINNQATDLKDFIIDVDELDEADRQGRELTWTVGDVKGAGFQQPMGTSTVTELFAAFIEECEQRGGDALVMKELPGQEFTHGAMSESRVVQNATPGKEFTAVCSLIPVGLVMFRITHICDGATDRPVEADARLVYALQAVMEAFKSQEE